MYESSRPKSVQKRKETKRNRPIATNIFDHKLLFLINLLLFLVSRDQFVRLRSKLLGTNLLIKSYTLFKT